jgi:hypothetical protein
VSDSSVNGRRRRRRLPPSEKYELWVSVLTGQSTQREAAERHKVDRLLDWERAAILDLFQTWGGIDRSHRKLAHRGSRLAVVHVSQ